MHEGHRGRVYKKFLADPSSLNEVELTELLLFYSIQVKDTKPIAYRLIERFGTARGVIDAPVEALRTVEGVGEKTVAFFKLLQILMPTVDREDEAESRNSSINAVKDMFIDLFAGATEEMMYFCLLDKDEVIISKMLITDFKRTQVKFDMKELVDEINRVHPYSCIIAHNHLSGNVEPSIADNLATQSIAFMLNVQNVMFYDHLIISGRKHFSYHGSGQLAKIKEALNKTITEAVKITNYDEDIKEESTYSDV